MILFFSRQIMIDHPMETLVDALNIEIITDENPPHVNLRPNRDQTIYQCSFIPECLTQHIISIDYAGVVPEKNPFYCNVTQEKDIQLMGPAMNNHCLVLNEPTHFYFKLTDFLMPQSQEKQLTYESGYSSNDDTSCTEIVQKTTEEEQTYRVTITDGHGRVKSDVMLQKNDETSEDAVRVDFTPNENILFINISCTW